MLTIGEFSKLSHISSRMLRYYDRMGLICPAHTGRENGYRYYDVSQFQTLLKIENLKGYGFTLSEIKELLPLPQEILAQKIHYRRLKAYEELNEMRKTLRHMEDDLMKMEGSDLMQEKYHVIVMETPPQRVFGIRKRINIAETHDLFQQLKEEMEKRGIQRAGATQLLYHGEEFSYENMDVEAQTQVAGEHPDIKQIPAQLCAVTTHIGPYENIRYAYDAICAWMAGHPEYKSCGPAIERYLKDEDTIKSPEELETGVLFPIKKIS
nr:MerR family transcriptional regulator [uncultured Caproiciproducens sp.]